MNEGIRHELYDAITRIFDLHPLIVFHYFCLAYLKLLLSGKTQKSIKILPEAP